MIKHKIGATVFTATDGKITKTQIVEISESTANDELKITYTTLEEKGYLGNNKRPTWSAPELYLTEEAAREALEAQIKKEIEEQYSRITFVDLTQARKA